MATFTTNLRDYMFLKKLLSFTCMLGFLFSTAPTLALEFKAGDQACIEITRMRFYDYEQSHSVVKLHVKILTTSPETNGFPYDVEVVVKKAYMTAIEKKGKEANIVTYNSESSKNSDNTEVYNKLINVPLYFTISNPCEIKETSGFLEQLELEIISLRDEKNDDEFAELDEEENDEELAELEDDELEEDDDTEYADLEEDGPGELTEQFLDFLSTLFHLSGENLVLDQNYQVNSCLYLDIEDLKYYNLETQETYTITSMDDKHIAATHIGAFKLSQKYFSFLTNINEAAEGQVTWNIDNPLLQNRTMKTTLEGKFLFYSIKGNSTTTWVSTPL